MHLNQDLRELLALEDGPAGFLSLYLDTSPHPDGSRAYNAFFRKQARDQYRLLQPGQADAARFFRKDLERIQRFLNFELREDTRGLALFSCAQRSYFKACQLPVSVLNKFVLSRAPNLQPLIELAGQNRHYCVVILRQYSARLASLHLSGLEVAQQINGTDVSGGSGEHSDQRSERRRQELIQQFMGQVSSQIDVFLREREVAWIVLMGTQANLAALRAEMPPRLDDRILITTGIPAGGDETALVQHLRKAISGATRHRLAERTQELYHRLCEDYSSVAGIEDTLLNLQMGKLARLFISADLEGAAYRCMHCGFLETRALDRCSYCDNGLERVELRNRMEKLAEHHKVDIQLVSAPSFLDDIGGVAGFLKF